MNRTAKDILRYLQPHVVIAGDYSARIQPRVRKHPAKGGATAFHQALSDADLAVQNYLEVALLAEFRELGYFSEEQDQSLNRKYFAADANLEVLLDPTDGTRAYIENRPHYQVIVAIHDRSGIIGALAYLPRIGVCYTATKGHGAYVLKRDAARSGHEGTRLVLTQEQGPILVFNNPDLCHRLSPHFEVFDAFAEYDQRHGRYHFTDILEGKALANISQPCQAIDGGALSFIAQEAGAVATDFHDKPMGNFRVYENRTIPELLVTANRESHERILTILQSR